MATSPHYNTNTYTSCESQKKDYITPHNHKEDIDKSYHNQY